VRRAGRKKEIAQTAIHVHSTALPEISLLAEPWSVLCMWEKSSLRLARTRRNIPASLHGGNSTRCV